jgi:cytochrome c biogenesis protein CcmG, thiol:disulfide interchange protein DsbE
MSSRQKKERRRQARLAAERHRSQPPSRRRDLTTVAIVVASVAVVVVAVVLVVSQRSGTSAAPAPAAAAADAPARGVPRQIAANAAQANRVIDGSIRDRLAALKGVPVVVNQWASWCPNCRQEFPFFQQLGRTFGRRVAFVGLDSQDDRGDADAFLRGFPVTYPSVYDPAAEQARSIGGGQGWPTTMYYDRTGRQTYVRQGGYVSLESLEADIRRYALGEGA